MTKINIAFAFDENLWLQTAVAVYSMCVSAPRRRYHIYCLTDQNVHASMKNLFVKIVKKSGNRRTKIHFIGFNGNMLSHEFYNDGRARFPRAAMARLFLPNILTHTRKIIWLDSDTIICGDLVDLWRAPIAGKFVGAARDMNIGAIEKKHPDEFTHYAEYGLREMVDGFEYINSGVLLMNLHEMRIFGWTEKCLKKIRNESRNIWFFDQDVINSISRGRIAYIPLRFNRMAKLPLGMEISAYQQAGLARGNLVHDFYNYTVLHYAGNDKPWNNAGPYCDIWRMYAKMCGVL